MAITWGALRQQVREGILLDNPVSPATPRWSDGQLLTYCAWALKQFAQHTALATATGYTPATGYTYQLPADIFDGDELAQTILVALVDGSATPKYLDPLRFTPPLTPMRGEGFTIDPGNVLRITTPSSSESSVLSLSYFAYYTPPLDENSIIAVPGWGEMAICYSIGAHALSGASVRSATIRQWASKPDAGGPEDNPFREQQAWFLKMYEREMLKHHPQDRLNAFRAIRDADYD